MHSQRVFGALTFASLLYQSWAADGTLGEDPIKNMCFRWYHQSTIKNGTVYISGGLETFVSQNSVGNYTGTPMIGYNNHTIEVSMREPWDWDINLPQNVIDGKIDSSSESFYPLFLSEGALFQGSLSDTTVWLFGGTDTPLNTSAETYQPPRMNQSTFWSLDTISGIWTSYDANNLSHGQVTKSPSGGAWAEIPDQGLGIYLSGRIDNGSNDGTILNYDSFALPGMVVFNFSDSSMLDVTNASTGALSSGEARLRGGFSYLSSFGEKGILAVIGGGSASSGENTTMGSPVSMSTIDIFDIASIYSGSSNGWYQQNTTGSAPDPRVDFCVVAISAPDNSSHQFYLYGGQNQNTLFDDIYVLSIPQFEWTRLYSGESPRWGHTCHLVGQSEILTLGGQKYANITQSCDWESSGVAIYNISDTTWGSNYSSDGVPYTIPGAVAKAIGGTPQGGATMKGPAGGYSSPALQNLMTGNSSSAVAQPSPSTSISGSAIGGIVGGLVAFFILLALSVWLILRYRRQKEGKQIILEADGDGNQILEKEGSKHRELGATEPTPELPHTGIPPGEPTSVNTRPRELGANEIPAQELSAGEIVAGELP